MLLVFTRTTNLLRLPSMMARTVRSICRPPSSA